MSETSSDIVQLDFDFPTLAGTRPLSKSFFDLSARAIEGGYISLPKFDTSLGTLVNVVFDLNISGTKNATFASTRFLLEEPGVLTYSHGPQGNVVTLNTDYTDTITDIVQKGVQPYVWGQTGVSTTFNSLTTQDFLASPDDPTFELRWEFSTESIYGYATVPPTIQTQVTTFYSYSLTPKLTVRYNYLPDAPLVLSVSDATVVEGDSGTRAAVFTVSLNAPSTATVEVFASTTPGTAKEDDFTAVSRLITFSPGDTRVEISVPIIGDTDPEDDQTFSMVLVAPSASDGRTVTIGKPVGSGTIVNDDTSITLLASDIIELKEGGADFVLQTRLAKPVPYDIVVDAALRPAGWEADVSLQSFTIKAYSTALDVPLMFAKQDNILEATESGQLVLTASGGGKAVEFVGEGVTAARQVLVYDDSASEVDKGFQYGKTILSRAGEGIQVIGALEAGSNAAAAQAATKNIADVAAALNVVLDVAPLRIRLEQDLDEATELPTQDLRAAAAYRAYEKANVEALTAIVGAGIGANLSAFAAGVVWGFTGAATLTALAPVLAGVAVGFGAAIVYDEFLADKVRDAARDLYRSLNPEPVFIEKFKATEDGVKLPVQAGLGAELLTGGEGQDRFVGTLAELDGDTIANYQAGEVIFLRGVSFDADAVSVTKGSTIIRIDANHDGIADSTITLVRDLDDIIAAGLRLSVVPEVTGTSLSFVRQPLPGSVRGTAGDDLIGPAGVSLGVTGGWPGSGDDEINGGAGNDVLAGGGGNDIFVFSFTRETRRLEVSFLDDAATPAQSASLRAWQNAYQQWRAKLEAQGSVEWGPEDTISLPVDWKGSRRGFSETFTATDGKASILVRTVRGDGQDTILDFSDAPNNRDALSLRGLAGITLEEFDQIFDVRRPQENATLLSWEGGSLLVQGLSLPDVRAFYAAAVANDWLD